MHCLQGKKLHVAFILLSLIVITGCDIFSSATQRDETKIRTFFKVPKNVQLISLDSSPKQGGTFGSEGLRIVAAFQFTEGQINDYRKSIENDNWKPLPIAPKIFKFGAPPEELARFTSEGFYTCKVMIFYYKKYQGYSKAIEEWIDIDNASTKFAKYCVGVLDLRELKLHVVYQSYH